MIDLDSFRAEATQIGAPPSPALEAVLSGLNAVADAMRAAGIVTIDDAMAGVPRYALPSMRAAVALLECVVRLSREMTNTLRTEVVAEAVWMLSEVAARAVDDAWGFVARAIDLAVSAAGSWVVLYASIQSDGVVH